MSCDCKNRIDVIEENVGLMRKAFSERIKDITMSHERIMEDLKQKIKSVDKQLDRHTTNILGHGQQIKQ